MSELITQEIFTDGQQNINAANMNGIIGRATVQPDVIRLKPVSATMNVADTFLVLKTDNTLAQARFDALVNSTGSTLPLADASRNGMLKQVSGLVTDFVDGTNNCQPVTNIIPTGTVWDTLAATAPAGWLLLQGQLVSRTTYAALFALLGTTYGVGDGSTTFGLPDARGRATIAAGLGAGLSTTRVLGAVGGEESHVLTTPELASHSHSRSGRFRSAAVTANASDPEAGDTTAGSNPVAATGLTGGNGAHNNMPPFLVTNKMVKV